ncbi:YpmS family protein [Streptococcus sp. DD13]|uniref:YpmS family protein n=1 Tax=Streptococcus sp. DD13 TaxID=1777881 RepID=UPI0007936ACD|nr:YfaA [Streptococcus sp. DD13]
MFFALLSFVIAFGLVLHSRLSTPREDMKQLQTSDTSKDAKIGTLTTNRAQLNDTIAVMLKSYRLDKYKLYADNQQILLEGKITLLGNEYPLYIYFQPSKLEDGSVLLTLKDFSVGTFQVPKETVLQALAKGGNLPDFVSIDAEKATLTIRLPEIENQLGIYVKANTIDLYNDQIIFDLYRKSS